MPLTADAVAQGFHEAYERLAPTVGYETRRESATPWADVPALNRQLMIAVSGEVLATVRAAIAAEIRALPLRHFNQCVQETGGPTRLYSVQANDQREAVARAVETGGQP